MKTGAWAARENEGRAPGRAAEGRRAAEVYEIRGGEMVRVTLGYADQIEARKALGLVEQRGRRGA